MEYADPASCVLKSVVLPERHLPTSHISAHLFNFERYSRSRQTTDGSLASILSSLSYQEKEGDSWLNPVQSLNMTVEYVTFTSIAGLTGVIIIIALVLIVTSATEFIWRSYFEVFWYTHHIYIIYVIGLWIHGIGGIVQGQTEDSMNESHPYRCEESFMNWMIITPAASIPSLKGSLLRPVRLQEIICFMRNRLSYTYPKAFEQQQSPIPRIEVDGPFGPVSEDVFQDEVAVLIRAGIGVTPFASILKSISTGSAETGAFSWFNDLMASLEWEKEKLGKVGFLNYHLFLTGWNSSIASHAALNFGKAADILTGLKQKTSFGKCMWDKFSTIGTIHPKSEVGVFFCGLQTLARSL
ncbi:NADPH oxidase 1 [Manis javanica]|nr:NADPH oxidase 1 [Manis javanica]